MKIFVWHQHKQPQQQQQQRSSPDKYTYTQNTNSVTLKPEMHLTLYIFVMFVFYAYISDFSRHANSILQIRILHTNLHTLPVFYNDDTVSKRNDMLTITVHGNTCKQTCITSSRHKTNDYIHSFQFLDFAQKAFCLTGIHLKLWSKNIKCGETFIFARELKLNENSTISQRM